MAALPMLCQPENRATGRPGRDRTKRTRLQIGLPLTTACRGAMFAKVPIHAAYWMVRPAARRLFYSTLHTL
jgi:hypothetical protein